MKDTRKGWCKIIETEKRDFLFQIINDEDNDGCTQLKITTHTNTCEVSTTVSSTTGLKYKDVRKMLDKANEDTIEGLINSIFQDEEFSLKLDELDIIEEEE